MKTTITDVAKQAGVSMKTVSRVLNNEPNVAKTTRERVMEVAEQLQYSPNLAARGLASSKSYLIALLYDNESPSYIAHIQRGAISACRANGYHLLLEPMTVEEATSPMLQRRLRRSAVDGVILTPPLSDSLELRRALEAMSIKFVAVGPEDPLEVPSVRMDDVEASYQMTRYLIEAGHKEIGFIKGPADHASSRQRFAGFQSALDDAGMELVTDLVACGDYSFRSGVSCAEKLLADTTQRPTAVFASNDDMAAGVMSVAGRLGIAVPKALSVCGFDDMPIAKIIWPQLTTVAQPIHDMGRVAAEMLFGKDKQSESLVRTLDFELALRGSTGVAPGG